MCTGSTTEERGGNNRNGMANSVVSETDIHGDHPRRPNMSRSILKPLKAKASKLRTWGDYNYTFKLQTQGNESMYQTSKYHYC